MGTVSGLFRSVGIEEGAFYHIPRALSSLTQARIGPKPMEERAYNAADAAVAIAGGGGWGKKVIVVVTAGGVLAPPGGARLRWLVKGGGLGVWRARTRLPLLCCRALLVACLCIEDLTSSQI